MNLEKAMQAMQAAAQMAAQHGGTVGDWLPQGAREALEAAMATSEQIAKANERRQRNAERLRPIRV